MEGSMLKSYREASYSAAVHQEAYSSEGSYAHTSPEYDAGKQGGRWEGAGKLQLINSTGKQELTGIDDDDESDYAAEKVSSCEEVEDYNNEDSQEEEANANGDQDISVDSDDYDIVECTEENVDDESGPVIHIFAVDPELDLEYSSDEEFAAKPLVEKQDWTIENSIKQGSVVCKNENFKVGAQCKDLQVIIENNEAADHVETELNVDDYFVKHKAVKVKKSSNFQNCLKAPSGMQEWGIASNESQVSAVYDTEDNKINVSEVSAEVIETTNLKDEVNIDEFFIKDNKAAKPVSIEINEVVDPSILPTIEPEIRVLSPHIEEYKKLLFEDTTPTKLNHSGRLFQKSLSLPHSPSHLPNADLDDGKTSLSFEDLNIHDFSDFNFDVDIRTSNKMFDISELNDDADGDAIRTLNDDDVNSFLITEPKKAGPEVNTKSNVMKVELEDDLSQQDMEIECPVESKIDISLVSHNTDAAEPYETSTPIQNPKNETLLDFCIEKNINDSIVTKDNTTDVKIEADDFVDVESLGEAVELPVLEANNVNSLLEQFEATEKFNNPNRKAPERKNKESTVNITSEIAVNIQGNGLMHGTRIQDAAILLNKNKMRQILMPSASPNCAAAQKLIPENVHADHDYCSPNKRSGAPAPASAPPRRRQSLLKPEVLSSNNLIKSSRHRTCKSKKIVYTLSSDDEDNIIKPKSNDKKEIPKDSLISNHRKKLSPTHSINTQVSAKPKCRSQVEPGSVILSASESKSSDTSSQCSSGSIKLTIKNKTKVILKLDSDENTDGLKPVIHTEQTKHDLKTETDKRLKASSKRVSENSLLKPLNKIKETAVISNETGKANFSSMVMKELPNIKKEVLFLNDISFNKKIAVIKKEVPTIRKEVPGIRKEVPAIRKEVPAIRKVVPAIRKDVPAVRKEVAIVKKEVPFTENKIPIIETYIPPQYYRNRDPLGLMVKEEPTDQTDDAQSQPEVSTPVETIVEAKQPARKKLNLQEYRLRKEGIPSNNSSRTVSPEAVSIANQDIFTINIAPAVEEKSTPSQLSSTDTMQSTPTSETTSNRSSPKYDNEEGKKIFDPIREASRKILMNSKKQKAEALRRRDEDIVMSKIPKVENLQLKPLISDVEMLQIVSKAAEVCEKQVAAELPKVSDYEEIIMVSIGINTDPIIKAKAVLPPSPEKTKESFKRDVKPGINFKIKKADQNSILKQNVFDNKRKPMECMKNDSNIKTTRCDYKIDTKSTDKPVITKDTKIDKERFKDITATLKRVEKNSDVKISSNSLFASIQDVVMKKAPESQKPEKEKKEQKVDERKRHRSGNLEDVAPVPIQKKIKTIIVNECPNEEHGEDKIILHLPKVRVKQESSSVKIQTEPDEQFGITLVPLSALASPPAENQESEKETEKPKAVEIKGRMRTDSGKSTSSLGSNSSGDRSSQNKRSISKGPSPKSKVAKQSPSRERRRSRRRSYSRSRSRSRSRHRSRSYDRQRRIRYPSYRRRSRSPYRSVRSRSPTYRSRRSPSYKRNDFRKRYCRSRSHSRHETPSHEDRRHLSPAFRKKIVTPEKSTTPPPKRVLTPDPMGELRNSLSPKKCGSPSMTPPLRKPTISESSDSSTSSSSSSSVSSGRSRSSGSRRSSRSGRSCYTPSPARSPARYRARNYSRSSSEDGVSIPPVEERRIVYVGKLDTDISKQTFRALFARFGPIGEVTLHTKDNGCKYGFVTFRNGRDAWTAVETARSSAALARYDVGFGGRRAFCRQRYADLDGLEAEYSESGYMGLAPPPLHPTHDVSFDVLLQEMKNKLKPKV